MMWFGGKIAESEKAHVPKAGHGAPTSVKFGKTSMADVGHPSTEMGQATIVSTGLGISSGYTLFQLPSLSVLPTLPYPAF